MAARKSRKTTKTNTKKKRSADRVLRDNVILIGIAVLCVLLFLSLIGLGGHFGIFARRIQFGAFGLCAWIFPLLLMGITVYLYVKQNEKGKFFIPAVLLVLFVLVCLLVQLLTGNYTEGDGILRAASYSMQLHLGGGLAGGIPEFALRGLFGLIGTYIIDIAGLILCVVALTGKSFIDIVGKKSNQAYHSSKDAIEKQKENWDTRRIERKEQKEQLRMEHIVSGVSEDMTVEEVTGETESADVPEEMQTGPSEPEDETANTAYAPLLTVEAPEYMGEVRMPFETGPLAEEPIAPQEEELPEDVYEDLPEEGDDAESPEEAAEADTHIPAVKTRSAEDAAENKAAAAAMTAQMEKEAEKKPKPYSYPPLSLLQKEKGTASGDRSAQQNMKKLQDTLLSFGVDVKVTGYEQGPTVTRYELLPAAGVKVSRILSLTDDIKLALAASDVRIEAPIPGKSAIGIEVPNSRRVTVRLRDLLETEAFRSHPSKIVFAAGKDISGNVILADIQKMPHLLIAGATGSGKSVCINTIVMSILYHADPNEVKLIMVDPKVVELSVYNGIPHLFTPVVTDPKKAAGALNWAVQEMTRRYRLFSEEHVRDIKSYNEKARQSNASNDVLMEVLPQIVIIVDELADLMMVAPNEVEDSICRLAQLARAAGLHLVIATQRPSVNVITGLIKANMPSRIAFSVSSGVDSRTILDMNGAEKLLGNGDMLYYPQGLSKPKRVQGAFVTDEEVTAVVNYLKAHNEEVSYHEEVASHELPQTGTKADAGQPADERDPLYVQAGRFLIESEKGSIGSLQRKFRIGFNRAARIVDQLTEHGVLGPEEGTKAREILMTAEEFEAMIASEGLNTDADH